MKFLQSLLFLLLLSHLAVAQKYYVYVAAESEDQVHLVQFDSRSEKASIAKTINVGPYPTEIDGPHGITVAPNGKYWFVSIAHGNPYGSLAKYSTETNELLGTTPLGLFPASMEISKQTGLLYVVNFDLHGPMRPSTFMVVDPDAMEVLAEVETGVMPHGTRLNSRGTLGYHVSMMSDELIEFNTVTMEIERKLKLTKNADDHNASGMNHSDMGHGSMNHKPVIKPTWADPHPTKSLVYVAGNGSDEIIEVNTNTWKITRRFKTGKAPYNLEVSPDGKYVVASYKGEGTTGVWDLKTGTEAIKIKNTRMVSHGVAITPDSKYAFISVEGIGGEPGSVDVIDLVNLDLAGHVDTGKQAGGIYFWKTVIN